MTEQTKEFEVEIVEEYDQDYNHLFKIITDAENRDIIAFIDRLLDELNLNILGRKWHSKYNSYIAYDFEPFNTAGFNIVVGIEYSEENESKIAFMKKILADWVKKVNQLNKLLAIVE